MSQCEFTWNPGVWPYVSNCFLEAGHSSPHTNKTGLQVPLTGEELPLPPFRSTDFDGDTLYFNEYGATGRVLAGVAHQDEAISHACELPLEEIEKLIDWLIKVRDRRRG